MSDYVFYDLVNKSSGADLRMLFPDFDAADERITFFSPHDDDALLGAERLTPAFPADPKLTRKHNRPNGS